LLRFFWEGNVVRTGRKEEGVKKKSNSRVPAQRCRRSWSVGHRAGNCNLTGEEVKSFFRERERERERERRRERSFVKR